MRILFLAGLALLLIPACIVVSPAPDSGASPGAPTHSPNTLQAPGPAAAPNSPSVRADLPDLGPAPELVNQVWLNTPGPLRLADLRGQVVLLDMWTFG
jgi:hypothetical protein